ncbi:GNAT family N-acetyltransferase [uncultured Massilia sp.]|uniref:GNAT family N-acetyltransferase n=1 Tax=uncultured Massilia sp. TaxID=169973 RepID=UPI0025FE33BF|nr:GNAT family N-acetyltransferase [uncultured Massilia sp.]
MTQIVPFSPSHADGVVGVVLPIQREEFGIPVTLAGQPDLLDIPGFYQQGDGQFWVALDGGVVVGTIALRDIGDGAGALRKMFVAASHRGAAQGVAQRLLDTLLDWARARDMRRIWLGTTDRFLAAHRFYARNGFEEVGMAALPAAFPVMAVDTKFYTRVP